jgi:hypothetical protein
MDWRRPNRMQPGINESESGEEQKIEIFQSEILRIASIVPMHKGGTAIVSS